VTWEFPTHESRPKPHSIRRRGREDAHDFQDYLTRLGLGRGWVNVSARLRDAIVGNMAEVYLNAFEHGQSRAGVFTCGQHCLGRVEFVAGADILQVALQDLIKETQDKISRHAKEATHSDLFQPD
jgi:hypothetical protein